MILIKLHFNTICAPVFLVIRKLYAISAKLISLSLRSVNFNRNCDKRREYPKFLTDISNFGKTHFILERVLGNFEHLKRILLVWLLNLLNENT